MLKIAVCMKQVPALNEGKMDESTGTIVRKDIPPVINPYDLAALEAALRIKDTKDTEISVFTMGPQGAESLLKEAFAMGADTGYLITDRAFAGADAVATAYTLAQAIQARGPYDLMICGRQTTDGDTAQVSSAIASFLNLPNVNWVTELQEVTETSVTVCGDDGDSLMTCRMNYPCLISVEREAYIPRIPSLRAKMASRKKQIQTLTLGDFPDSNPERYGMAGSGTKVVKIFTPKQLEHSPVAGMDGTSAAAYILQILTEQMGGGV
jgi:electron transfer flavoprotein beta subunit